MTTNLDNILATLVEANAALEQLPKLKEQLVYLNHDLDELGQRGEPFLHSVSSLYVMRRPVVLRARLLSRCIVCRFTLPSFKRKVNSST